MSFKIITDSTATLSYTEATRYDVSIVSLYYLINGESTPAYDGENTKPIDSFYNKLLEKPKVSTSCANESQYYEAFENAVKSGLTVLYVGFSSGVSASFSCAVRAKESLLKKYPNVKIYCADTLTGSLGQKHFVMRAIQMRNEGFSAEDAYNYIIDNRLKMHTFVTVDDLYLLYQGGRIPSLTYKIGSIINIKPIVIVTEEGKLKSYEKVISRKQSLSRLLKIIKDKIALDEFDGVYIAHGNCEAEAKEFGERIKDETGASQIIIDQLEPVIGSHTGVGTIAVFFTASSR